jgi:hypothetical protein
MVQTLFKLGFITNLAVGAVSLHAECPKDKGEAQLSFTQVMLNFGRFLRPADSTALKGMDFPGDVTAGDVQQAVNGIDVALSCAAVVLTEPPILPEKVKRMPPADAAIYSERVCRYMESFRALLVGYRDLFVALPETRNKADFEALYEQSRKVRGSAAEAHENL